MHATRYILYIYIIGIAFLLQGCNRESHPNTPKPEAISMVAAEVGTTRALMNNVTDLQAQGFKVYGYKVDKADYKQQVFTDNGQGVSYDGANGWSYSPLRYWDRTANYWFAAYAPTSLPGNMVVTNNITANQTLTFTKFPNWQSIDGSGTDLIVATSQGAATTYLDNEGVVDLTFDHVYAQLVVRVIRSASLQNTYKLTSIAYSNVPTVDGTATYTLDYTTPTNSKWNGVAISSEWMNAYSNAGGEEITSNPEATPGAKHLVVPFTGSDNIKVTVNYTANGEPQSGTADIGISQLEAGKRYVLTLSLGGGAIITPTLDIEKWIEVQDEKETEVNEDDKYNW